MNNKIDEECHVCPDCDEDMRTIPMLNESTKDLDNILICYCCDQAYIIKNKALCVLPFNSKMEIIKIHCKTCDFVANHRQKIVYVVNDEMTYDHYCPKCAIEFIKKDMPDTFKELNEETIFCAAETHAIMKQNKIMQDPKKMNKILNSKPYVKIKEMIKKADEMFEENDENSNK